MKDKIIQDVLAVYLGNCQFFFFFHLYYLITWQNAVIRSIDPATGSLYTSEKLDHEAIHQHILTVMVGLSVHCSATIWFLKGSM